MMYNHPCSSIPSVADVNALKATGCRLGVVVAHDGTVYTYELVGDPTSNYNLDKETLELIVADRSDDETKALEAVEQLLGVRIVHLSPRV